MKHNTLIYLLAALSLLSCTGKEAPSGYEESLAARLPGGSRFAVTAAGKSVWNKGDSISVFVDRGENEGWYYAGTDAASSGSFKHITSRYRLTRERIDAICPYDAACVMSGNAVPVTLGSRSPLLAASGSEVLNFHYLTSLVRLQFDRVENVKAFVLRPGGGLRPGGSFSVDFSSDVPVLRQDAAADTLVLPGGNADLFWLNVPPGDYSGGFTIDVKYVSGGLQTIRHTSSVDFKAGEVLDISAVSSNYSLVLNVDFRASNPFEEKFPTSKTSGGRDDRTFTLVQDGESYKFKFHPGYFEYNPLTDPQGRSGKEYGYARQLNNYFTPSQYGMTIGRDSSYIKLPAVPGKQLVKFEYLAGNVSSGPYLAKDSLGVEHFSKMEGSSYVGEIRTIFVDYLKRCEDTPYFVFVTGGNFLLLWYKVYYR